MRLALSFAATLVIVGIVGYLFMNRQLRQSQIARFAATQRANAATFQRFDAGSKTRAGAIFRIDQVLEANSSQEGTLETLLIAPNHKIVAAGSERRIGRLDSDPRIDAALAFGQQYAGHETATNRNPDDFEFVVPVNLQDGRYAFETSYDHTVLDAQLADLRRGLMLVGLLALLGGSLIFYLFGGRALLRSHRQALKRATLDGLTDLPNHRAFQDELPQAVAATLRNDDTLALIALDIDDFKFVNDRHGHPHGDAILERVAAVLREGRPGDRAFRIGGDEFALLLPHTDADGARVIGQRLLRSLSGAKLDVTMGVSASRTGHATDLRAEAEAALCEAKRRGGNQIACFDDIRNDVAVVGTEKRAAVHRLIEEGLISTAYQPIWDISRNTLLGVEALSRPDAGYGLDGPAEAFDIAEQIGHVHDLDVACIHKALAGARNLPAGVLLFLNLCPSTLDLDAAGSDWLRSAVEASGFPLDRVVIEVTERFGGRTASIVKCLKQLRAQGFKIAIDDVGTGNSGLEMLRHVTVEFVKLDRSIVASASTEPGARAVLMAIATFARQTGSFVIAEGIEDDETLDFVRGIDDGERRGNPIIQGGQGYGLGRPGIDFGAMQSLPERWLPKAA